MEVQENTATAPAGGENTASTEPASIRDTLSAALKAQEAPQDAAQSGSEPSPATTAAEAEAAAQRARDEKGRFAAKEGKTDAGKTPDADALAAQAADTPKPDAGKAIQAPASMKPEEREAFSKLPMEQQQFVARREAEMTRHLTKVTQEVASERKFYGEMQQPLTAVARFAQHFNAHPGQIIGQWAAVQDGLLRDPVNTIKGLAQQFKVDLAQLSPGQQQEQPYIDPQVAALQQKLAAMEQFVTGQQQQEEFARRQSEQAARHSVESSISDFATATDDVGQPKYPHFENLRPHMAALIESGAAKDLSEAYDQAMWSRPDLREQLLAAQRAEAQRQQQDAQRQQAAKAKAAAVSVAGAPGGVVPPPGPADTSIRALLSRGAGVGA